MASIDVNIRMKDFFQQYPEAVGLLTAYGLERFVKGTFMEISPHIKLKTILKESNLDEEIFMKMLQEKLCSNVLRPSLKITDKMNLLALLPCPLKVPLQEAFEQFIEKERVNFEEPFEYLLEGNANNQYTYYEYVEKFESLDQMPDCIITPGINGFYYKKFVDRFIRTGAFVDVVNYMPNAQIEKIGMKDPDRHYTMLTLNPLVMVVDKLQLGNIPVPRKWEDLLNPEFEKKVALRGQNDQYCETTLLTFYKEYGMKGIQNLAKTIQYAWHPSQMAKAAGSGKIGSPVVSILPYFFTKTIKNKENVEVVWPEEGAVVSPVTMLVKAEKVEKLKKITDYLTGSEIGKICADAAFPSMHPDVDNAIPKEARFHWIGWDFIKEHDLEPLIQNLNLEFGKYLR